MFVRVEEIAKILTGEWSCYIDGQQVDMNIEENIEKYKNYEVHEISNANNRITLKIKRWETPTTKVDPNEAWYQEHIKQFGRAPDYF